MTYYAATQPMMAGMSGTLTEVVKAPISRWNQSSTIHKMLVAGAGAGLAYYLHQKGMADAAVAVAGVAGAYATSMALHYPVVSQQAVMAPAPAPIPAGLPAANQTTQQPMSGMVAASSTPSAPPPAAPGSKWALLG